MKKNRKSPFLAVFERFIKLPFSQWNEYLLNYGNTLWLRERLTVQLLFKKGQTQKPTLKSEVNIYFVIQQDPIPDMVLVSSAVKFALSAYRPPISSTDSGMRVSI